MNALTVSLGPCPVGLLERFEDEEYCFSFDSSWLHTPEHPVLGQLFEDRRPADIVTSGLPCWFTHLLPQGPLRRAIERQARLEGEDDFNLLRVLGEDLPGAVVATPAQPRLSRTASPPPPPPAGPQGGLRFSLAGNQWKLSVRLRERGLTIPVLGETGFWIAKFHSPTFKDLPRVEYATMRWAEACGIAIAPVRMAQATDFDFLPEGLPTGDGTVFLIERFDRTPVSGRIHIEDFAQVLDRPLGNEYTGRYEHLAAVLAHLSREDLRPFCERLVFCALSGNTDAHLKNWSLIYPDGRHPRLAPAYDLVASVLYVPEIDDELALELGGSRRFQDIRTKSFCLLAEVTNLSFDEVATWVRQAAERIRTAWQEKAAELPYLPAERARLDQHMARIPLAAETRAP